MPHIDGTGEVNHVGIEPGLAHTRVLEEVVIAAGKPALVAARHQKVGVYTARITEGRRRKSVRGDWFCYCSRSPKSYALPFQDFILRDGDWGNYVDGCASFEMQKSGI